MVVNIFDFCFEIFYSNEDDTSQCFNDIKKSLKFGKSLEVVESVLLNQFYFSHLSGSLHYERACDGRHGAGDEHDRNSSAD